jgi:hypothetical protein
MILDSGWSCEEVALDHDDFGLNQSKIMNVIDSNKLERDMQISLRNLHKLDCAGKPDSTFPHPALALPLDDDTIHLWHGLSVADGLERPTRFEAGGSACQVSGEQQEKLKAWAAAALARSTREIGVWAEPEYGMILTQHWTADALQGRLNATMATPLRATALLLPSNPWARHRNAPAARRPA